MILRSRWSPFLIFFFSSVSELYLNNFVLFVTLTQTIYIYIYCAAFLGLKTGVKLLKLLETIKTSHQQAVFISGWLKHQSHLTFPCSQSHFCHKMVVCVWCVCTWDIHYWMIKCTDSHPFWWLIKVCLTPLISQKGSFSNTKKKPFNFIKDMSLTSYKEQAMSQFFSKQPLVISNSPNWAVVACFCGNR